ncbi:nuclease-related domain-containing protein [Aquipuribacter hungaricus]|uniref:Nuclease-related domain-containing protein n=1 Tax=Aquipuribacter hungaricus TaxID=545624 RepID=A0ABV7WJ48_9MICO
MPAGVVLLLLSLPAIVPFGPLASALGLLVGAAVVALPIWSSPTAETMHHRTGVIGELEVGRWLQAVVERQQALGRGAGVLLDRGCRGSENADHVVVASAGVTVVEAKNWSGCARVHKSSYYAGQRSSVDKAAVQANRQAATVRRALVAEGVRDVPVHAVVCLVGQARPRVALQVKGVTVCGADQLWAALPTGTLGTRQQLADVAGALDRCLRAA